ncbi:AcrR family transcriptional regulator [Clostridium acetobutylicum]|uniref:TetR family HTH transcriptional regulator n=1 Tax=Clostridium acetobutylicum (strain ATCC 824 / DSM 792 / JCM 1419 / IAM 19013 / LMG 5710 / NBRC 13948 / NRRL B-527 / VKM B-1787 / 2291 / W) TaxID=272562 RepID=Q97TQ2_CLOAB|nr:MULTISPECIES: TetR-like C-terminal domain-containing protein [Clostridium]AAK76792.1 TetR family HTH transcriptional regulator [Clostridium acetobutylicum ATCC 824]ADZ22828.1 TetR family HTH transcriptional regulator [Clostridium acetobutylicum EA 2018]AEI34788.1 TetR family HTH transcriptional regulator [Clostridium acetobutylicum DSM 1731]AWV82337.1 TetR/AcrR family transcriptional regulator [Clostridium acetobutylicum]MBC2395999.1 TetR/AcrR family transcriptional regulator [Clostridium a
MKNRIEDRRIKYTKMVIKQSLITLLKNKPINKVTVTEICNLADINRSTFYTHYSNPYDLLDSIEEELFEEVKSSLRDSEGETKIENTVNEIFKAIAKNKELFKIFFSSHRDYGFLIKFFGAVYNNSIDNFKSAFKSNNDAQLEYLYNYILTGNASISYKWIKNGLKESPEEMASLVNRLIVHTMSFIK